MRRAQKHRNILHIFCTNVVACPDNLSQYELKIGVILTIAQEDFLTLNKISNISAGMYSVIVLALYLALYLASTLRK